MYLDEDDWNTIYEIEERVNSGNATNDDAKELLKLVWKMNGNVIDPRTHDKIQKLINTL